MAVLTGRDQIEMQIESSEDIWLNALEQAGIDIDNWEGIEKAHEILEQIGLEAEAKRRVDSSVGRVIALTEKDKQVTVNELIKTVNILSNQSDLISIVNSFDDTLTDKEFLVQIQEWNNANR